MMEPEIESFIWAARPFPVTAMGGTVQSRNQTTGTGSKPVNKCGRCDRRVRKMSSTFRRHGLGKYAISARRGASAVRSPPPLAPQFRSIRPLFPGCVPPVFLGPLWRTMSACVYSHGDGDGLTRRWGEKYTDSQLATMKTTLRKLTIWLRAQSLGSKRARCPRSGGLGLGWVLLCSTLAAGGETRYVNLNNPTPALPTPPGLRPLPTSSTP